jgi:hypothetical protein
MVHDLRRLRWLLWLTAAFCRVAGGVTWFVGVLLGKVCPNCTPLWLHVESARFEAARVLRHTLLEQGWPIREVNVQLAHYLEFRRAALPEG